MLGNQQPDTTMEHIQQTKHADVAKARGPGTRLWQQWRKLNIKQPFLQPDHPMWFENRRSEQEAVLQQTVQIWDELARTRRCCKGLGGTGPDPYSTRYRGTTPSDKRTARQRLLMANAVYTPARANLLNGAVHLCHMCGKADGDWEHMLWDCPAYPLTDGIRALPSAETNMAQR